MLAFRSTTASLALGALLLTGCLIDRGALSGPPTPGIDADRPDAHVEPGVDAPIEAPDAFAPPEIDAYTEPSPDAGMCDEVGEACCASATCRDSALMCTPGGRCDVIGCGGLGARCCLGDVCFGTSACAGGLCERCGGDGGPCCAGATCDSGLACGSGRCGPCGTLGLACCSGACREGECSGDTCRPPAGTRGGPCRGSDPRDQCDMNLACRGGECVACGASTEPCCPGFQCRGSSLCIVDYCT